MYLQEVEKAKAENGGADRTNHQKRNIATQIVEAMRTTYVKPESEAAADEVLNDVEFEREVLEAIETIEADANAGDGTVPDL